MEEKKMSKDDTIKGLECCQKGIEVPCRECPYYEYGRTCQKHLTKDALDMIYSLTDRIEELEGQNAYECGCVTQLQERLKELER